MQLSIVTTLYGSAAHVDEFWRRIQAAADGLSVSYELVVVNDGGPDDSLGIAVGMAAADRRIRVVDLARRYGHYEAILAGIRQACGDAIVVIAADLDEPPELVETLWRALGDGSTGDLVVACHARRPLRSVADVGGWLYYRMLRAQTGLDIPLDNFVARIMTRRYADALVALRERPVSFDALSARAGFHHRTIAAEKAPSRGTTYSLGRRAALFVDSMLAYGSRASLVVAVLAGAVLVLGVVAASTSPRAFQIVAAVAAGAILAGLAVLYRYLDLVLEELRYTPARVRRIYPDE
jgi:putative glycosyltransferase